MNLTKLLTFIAIMLVVAVIIAAALIAEDEPEADRLSAEMQAHTDLCHKSGMGAGKIIEGDKIVGIKCYEK